MSAPPPALTGSAVIVVTLGRPRSAQFRWYRPSRLRTSACTSSAAGSVHNFSRASSSRLITLWFLEPLAAGFCHDAQATVPEQVSGHRAFAERSVDCGNQSHSHYDAPYLAQYAWTLITCRPSPSCTLCKTDHDGAPQPGSVTGPG